YSIRQPRNLACRHHKRSPSWDQKAVVMNARKPGTSARTRRAHKPKDLPARSKDVVGGTAASDLAPTQTQPQTSLTTFNDAAQVAKNLPTAQSITDIAKKLGH